STLLATVVVTELTPWDLEAVIFVTGAGALVALMLGLADDILTIRATYRLVVVLALTGLMAAFGARVDVLGLWPDVMIQLPYALAIIGSMAWLVVVINAVNFMDGANGLAMGMAAIAALALSLCGAITGQWTLALLAM